MTEKLQPVIRLKPEYSAPLGILGLAIRQSEEALALSVMEKQKLIRAGRLDFPKIINNNVRASHLVNARKSMLVKAALLLVDVEATRKKMEDVQDV